MRADGEVRDHVGGSVQKLTPVFSPGVPFLCFGFRLAARAMGGAISMGAADGRSPNPDHGRCRCRWRAARRKDMRLRTGGSAHAGTGERENKDMRERPRAETTCGRRAARGARAGCTRPMHTAARSTPVHGAAAVSASGVLVGVPLYKSPACVCPCRLSGGTTSTTRFIGEAPVEARDATEDLLGTQYQV